MKKLIISYTRFLCLMLFSVLLMGFKSDLEKTITVTETATVNSTTHLKVKNNCGPIEFKSTTGTEARFEATLMVQGESEEEIKKVLDQFQISVSESGSTVDVVAEDNVKNWVQYKSWFVDKNTITFNDGTEAKDITEMEVSFVVYLPEVNSLSIRNRYDEVRYDSFTFDVEAELFSSDFRGGDIKGDLDLSNKYGEINIGNIEDGDFSLFDCDSRVKNANNINLNIKYSDLEFEDVQNCEMNSFDDTVKFGNIANEIEIDAKYSEFEIGNFGRADFKMFDCETKGGSGAELDLESKYSEFNFGDINSISIDLFQDALSFDKVDDLFARNTKYSEVDLDRLETSFKAISSFQDNFDIDLVGSAIQNLELDGKYTDLNFPIPSDVSYSLDANLRYSTFVFPEVCKKGDQDNGDQSFNVDCEVRNPTPNSLKVKINVFDGDIILK